LSKLYLLLSTLQKLSSRLPLTATIQTSNMAIQTRLNLLSSLSTFQSFKDRTFQDIFLSLHQAHALLSLWEDMESTYPNLLKVEDFSFQLWNMYQYPLLGEDRVTVSENDKKEEISGLFYNYVSQLIEPVDWYFLEYDQYVLKIRYSS
jgi:hypothetical protein